MASNSGGGLAGRKRAKDQAMAAALKAAGIARTIFRCPICNGLVALGAAYPHLAFHGRPRKEREVA